MIEIALLFLLLVCSIYLIFKCKTTLWFSGTFLLLSILSFVASPIISSFFKESYIVRGWRSLNSDAWLVSNILDSVFPQLIFCIACVGFFMIYEKMALLKIKQPFSVNPNKKYTNPNSTISLLFLMIIVIILNSYFFILGLVLLAFRQLPILKFLV